MRSQNSDSAIAVGGAGDASEGGKSLGRVLERVQGVDVAIQEIFWMRKTCWNGRGVMKVLDDN
jgi:hypothetical protein